MKTLKNTWIILAGFAMAFWAPESRAASSVTIDNVVQRWPWNNKLDITYTVSGGQDVSQVIYRKLIFTCVIDGVTNVIDGVRDVGANASDGQHTVTWTAPSGYRTDKCTMSAALYESDTPSGDDYMIVNLETGEVSYEGILASQEASDLRYNNGWYKTTNMVFRKISAGTTYQVGDATFADNLKREWLVDRDFYVGIFMVTQWQYAKITGSNPSGHQQDAEGNKAIYRPVTGVRYSQFRNFAAPGESVPQSENQDGVSFLQRLNAITRNKLDFDLPTEVMWEIAARANVDTPHFWGNNWSTGNHNEYVIHSGNAGGLPMEVGKLKPNAFGLFDVTGNMWEFCRDAAFSNKLHENGNLWTAVSADGVGDRRLRGGATWGNEFSQMSFCLGSRGSADSGYGGANSYNSFRVACVMK